MEKTPSSTFLDPNAKLPVIFLIGELLFNSIGIIFIVVEIIEIFYLFNFRSKLCFFARNKR